MTKFRPEHDEIEENRCVIVFAGWYEADLSDFAFSHGFRGPRGGFPSMIRPGNTWWLPVHGR
jgi:hypothetical protein